MTKRDVAVWFCKVVALGGTLSAVFHLLGVLIPWNWNFSPGNLLGSILPIGLYSFVWLFARGIGTEIAAEGEHGLPITSVPELGTLLLRCVGLSLFLSGALTLGSVVISVAYEYFSSPAGGIRSTFYWPSIISQFMKATLGFFLAFGPRLRAAMRGN